MDGISSNYASRSAAGTGNATSSGVSAALRDLKKQYPDLKLSAQSFSGSAALRDYASKQSGLYNVAIHPKALANMANDPELSAQLNDSLGKIKETHDQAAAMINARGANVVAMGSIVDENGETTGMWSVSESKSGDGGLFASGKDEKDHMKALEEKRAQRREEEKRLEKKRKEEEDRAAWLEVDVSASLEASASVEASSTAAADTVRAPVDFTA